MDSVTSLFFLFHILRWAFISSPELKVSFSDRLLSVCKLFTFASSLPKPLSQFQSDLAQNILVWMLLKFIQMNGHALFQGKILRNSKNKEIMGLLIWTIFSGERYGQRASCNWDLNVNDFRIMHHDKLVNDTI